MTTDDEKTLSATRKTTTTTTTTTSSIPRTDSYQQMKRAMESFNIEESMVRFFLSFFSNDDKYGFGIRVAHSLVFSSSETR